jgi:hypothetical protein
MPWVYYDHLQRAWPYIDLGKGKGKGVDSGKGKLRASTVGPYVPPQAPRGSQSEAPGTPLRGEDVQLMQLSDVQLATPLRASSDYYDSQGNLSPTHAVKVKKEMSVVNEEMETVYYDSQNETMPVDDATGTESVKQEIDMEPFIDPADFVDLAHYMAYSTYKTSNRDPKLTRTKTGKYAVSLECKANMLYMTMLSSVRTKLKPYHHSETLSPTFEAMDEQRTSRQFLDFGLAEPSPLTPCR